MSEQKNQFVDYGTLFIVEVLLIVLIIAVASKTTGELRDLQRRVAELEQRR